MTSRAPISINLASDPFRRERADNLIFAAICGILFCSLAVLVGLLLHARSQSADLHSQIARVQERLDEVHRQQNRYSTVLAKPENAGTFANSVFINQLIARRAVSWTRVFQDLSTVMPSNVRLVGIHLPQVDADDESGASRVELDMVVGSTQPEAVIGLLKNLQKSSLFGAASVVSQNPPPQNETLYKYRLTVPYDQKL